MERIRVLIADDHAVLRAGLRMLINTQPDMAVVGEAANAGEAVAKALEAAPDVALMDLTMAGGSGIKAIERMRQECPQVRVLVLTMHDDLAYLRSALAAGGCGYVVKKAADSELLSAIRAVYRGHMFVDLASGGCITQDAHANPATRDPARPGGVKNLLSQREQEVLTMLAKGYTNQQIADRLHLSVKTVETYRSRIAEKLELKGRSDLVRYALEIGILGPEVFTQDNEPL